MTKMEKEQVNFDLSRGYRKSFLRGFFKEFCKLELKYNRSLRCSISIKQTSMVLLRILHLMQHFGKPHKCEKIKTMMC